MLANSEVMIKEEEDEVSFFQSCQLSSPLDFSWESCLPLLQGNSPLDDNPLMDMGIFGTPFHSSLDFVPTNNFLQGDYFYGLDDVLSFQNVMNGGVSLLGNESLLPYLFDENNNQQVIHNVNKEKKEKPHHTQAKEKRNNSTSNNLSKEVISQYFNMPITQAAKKLNTGTTYLKKRCRDLGIQRWPHRKLASIQTLIKNVHELSKDRIDGHEDEQKLRDTIETLEREKMLIKELPDMELMEGTKRLRQSCFKANYKRRKIMGMKNSSSPLQCSTITTQASEEGDGSGVIDFSGDGEEEIIQSLLADCFSSSNDMFLV